MDDSPNPSYADPLATLYHGDGHWLMRSLPDSSVDLVLTDPPYGVPHRRGALYRLAPMRENDEPGAGDRHFDMLVRESARILKPGGALCCCAPAITATTSITLGWITRMSAALSYRTTFVWDKKLPSMGHNCYRSSYELVLIATKGRGKCAFHGGAISNLACIPRLNWNVRRHPTEKPISLMMLFVKKHTQDGDVVVDPFAGAGTTLVAATKLGRRAVGAELNETYCRIAAERLSQQHLGLEANSCAS